MTRERDTPRWFPRSLRRQLLAGVLAVVTVVLVAVGVVSVLSLRGYVTTMNDAEVAKSLHAFDNSYTRYRNGGTPPVSQALLEFTGQTPGNVIAVLHDGVVIGSAVFSEDEARPAPADVVRAIEGQRWYDGPPRTETLGGLGPYRVDCLVEGPDILVVGVSLNLADRIIAISQRFADHLVADYGIQDGRIGIVPNPIDLDRFFPRPRPGQPGAPLKLLFVSRIAVRKGVELIVDLSHRLDDMHGKVEIVVVGSRSTWSDYRKLLDDVNPRVARYLGGVKPDELAALYGEAAAVLQPSHYEPFALSVGEALAAGTPVIASDEVGAVEGVDRRVCTVFPCGDRAGPGASRRIAGA